MKISEEEAERIRERSQLNLKGEPLLIGITFLHGDISFSFVGRDIPLGMSITVPSAAVPGLEGATDGQIRAAQIVEEGYSIHWPELGVQLSSLALLEALTGLRSPASHQELALRSISPAKAAANGAKGGRPRKGPVKMA